VNEKTLFRIRSRLRWQLIAAWAAILIVVAGGILFALAARVRSLLLETEVEKLRPAVRELTKLCSDYYMSPSEGKLKVGFAKIMKDFPDLSYLLFRDATDGVHWHAETEGANRLKNHAASIDPRVKPIVELEVDGDAYINIGGVTDTLPRLPVSAGFAKSLLQRKVRGFFWNKGGIALLAVAGGIIVGVLVCVWLTRPVVRLSLVAEKMSLGDMDVRLDLKCKGEIGRVYLSLERLRESVLYALRRLNGRERVPRPQAGPGKEPTMQGSAR